MLESMNLMKASIAGGTRAAGTVVVMMAAALAIAPGALAQVPAACGDQPRLECKKSEKSQLSLKQAGGTKDKLTWKWPKGAATALADFGDPTTSADYALCFYAGNHAEPVAGASIPAGASLWKALGTKGYKYTDKSVAPDGILKVLLKAGAEGKTKAIVKGKGANLPDPTLPPNLPLLVQLVNTETADCYEDVYDGSDL
ncbi:MAG: hypothetical protein V3R77_03570, partial [Candidatus Binatia bacterium]